MTTYQLLGAAISDAGYFTTGDFETKLICASKIHPEGGDTGNGFWVAQKALEARVPHAYDSSDAIPLVHFHGNWRA